MALRRVSTASSAPSARVRSSLRPILGADQFFHPDARARPGLASHCPRPNQPLQPFNISEDPYEETNLAAERPDKGAELREFLGCRRQLSPESEKLERIVDYPPTVYGEVEDSEFAQEFRKRPRKPEQHGSGRLVWRPFAD